MAKQVRIMKRKYYDIDEEIENLSEFFEISKDEILDIVLNLGVEVARSTMEAQKLFEYEVGNAKDTKS